MERPEAFANLWLILQTVGFIIALDGVADFVTERHYNSIFRRLLLLYFDYFHGLEYDPAEPRLPDSWEQWYNS